MQICVIPIKNPRPSVRWHWGICEHLLLSTFALLVEDPLPPGFVSLALAWHWAIPLLFNSENSSVKKSLPLTTGTIWLHKRLRNRLNYFPLLPIFRVKRALLLSVVTNESSGLFILLSSFFCNLCECSGFMYSICFHQLPSLFFLMLRWSQLSPSEARLLTGFLEVPSAAPALRLPLGS